MNSTPIPTIINRQCCYQGDAAAAAQRVRAFWNREALDRPLLQIRIRKDPPPGPPSRTRTKQETDWNPDWHARAAVNYLNSFTFRCEALPSVSPNYAHNIGFSGEILGGEYQYAANGHAYICPRPAALDMIPAFDPDAACHRNMRAVMEAIDRRIGADIGLIPPVIGVDPYTVLSLFLGAEQLITAMLDEDERLLTWAAAATEVQCATYEHYHGFTVPHASLCSSWLSLPAFGRMEAVQCDFAAMLSPALFAQYIVPMLQRFCAYFDHTVYHLDGVGQRMFLPHLANIRGLRGIQWNPEPRERDPLRWIGTFKQIKDLGLALHFEAGIVGTVATAMELVRQLGADGLSLALPPFPTEREADLAIAALEHVTRPARTAGFPDQKQTI